MKIKQSTFTFRPLLFVVDLSVQLIRLKKYINLTRNNLQARLCKPGSNSVPIGCIRM
jgi:hypothetical protein